MAADGVEISAIVACLKKRGFCILRNLFTADMIDSVKVRADQYLAKPAIAGAPGYWQVDHPKKLVHPFTMGGPTLDLMLNDRVIDIVEEVMDSECILAECILKLDKGVGYTYFPMHSDFSVGWAKSPTVSGGLTLAQLKKVVGVGAAIYLADTNTGAFSYCDSTHHLLSPKGQNLNAYSDKVRQMILARKVRCDGLKGDLVLFDDRGFHGPDQPSKTERLVILLDYFHVGELGRTQVSPMPIWSSDIAQLSAKQLRVAGVGADFMVPPGEYAHTRFKKNPWYQLITWLVSRAYFWQHFKFIIKRLLGRT